MLANLAHGLIETLLHVDAGLGARLEERHSVGARQFGTLCSGDLAFRVEVTGNK